MKSSLITPKLHNLKYSGCGNDFVILDDFDPEIDISEVCKNFTTDGVIFKVPSVKADFGMRIFNADGSEAEMCGNGLRCFGIHLAHLGEKFTIEVMNKLYPIQINGNQVTVQMGPPLAEEYDIKLNGYTLHYLDTGVPHVLIESKDDVLDQLGPFFRHHPRFFPRGTNVNIYYIENGVMNLRTWERGVEGETLACGTGATACAIVGNKKHFLQNPILVKPKSGEILTFHIESDKIQMQGPAKKIDQ